MPGVKSVFDSEQLSHVSSYSGVFQTGQSYQKFDFAYNKGDGLFYYAKENMSFGGGATIEESNRISLVPDGPLSSNGETYYILDTFNDPSSIGASFEDGQIVSLNGASDINSNGLYRIVEIQKNLTSLNNDPSLTGAAINVVGIEGSRITSLEIAGPNPITLSEVNIAPEESDALWTADKFFFDADYGSSVKFSCSNHKFEYGNGYYINQAKNINPISFEVDLSFKNRSNRESNAIIHFLENHQGQGEKDYSSPNLTYSQGIAGFSWDGNSTFHPYDSLDNQTKSFYCNEFSHSLNFENNNDINVKLRNFTTSILNKSESLFTSKADTYSSLDSYEKNDVVFNLKNQRYYYCKKENVNIPPVQENLDWSRADGLFTDINLNYWSREFFWKPSIGLSISQQPRVLKLGLGGGYTQIYKDGINESLLSFDVKFDNRSDDEVYSILHFLEQHYGCIPFMFSPPAPYETPQNFVCQEWTHTYNFKNNHSITARFEQFPFDFSAQQYDNQSAPPPPQSAELYFSNPFVMSEQNVGATVFKENKLKKRLNLKNIGDSDLLINSINLVSLGDRIFSKLGGAGVVVASDLDRSSYTYSLPVDKNLPFDLDGRTIKISKHCSDGPGGGQSFVLMKREGGQFIPDGFGLNNYYFQNNKGQIKTASSKYVDCNYFVVEQFITNNNESTIPGKGEAYIDIESSPNASPLGDVGLNFGKYGEHFAQIEINNNGAFPASLGTIKIFVE